MYKYLIFWKNFARIKFMLNECDKFYDCLVIYFQDEFWETIFFNHFYYFIKMQNLLEIEKHI